MERRTRDRFFLGVNQGLPIGLGYLSVSFTFGIMAVSMGLPWWAALLISMTNLTSAGQVAGIVIIVAGGGYVELALSQLVINLRYALMSLTLSQKLDASVTRGQRFLMAFGITDEIFALAASRDGRFGFGYFLGLLVLPYLGWASGTLLGASAGSSAAFYFNCCAGNCDLWNVPGDSSARGPRSEERGACDPGGSDFQLYVSLYPFAVRHFRGHEHYFMRSGGFGAGRLAVPGAYC